MYIYISSLCDFPVRSATVYQAGNESPTGLVAKMTWDAKNVMPCHAMQGTIVVVAQHAPPFHRQARPLVVTVPGSKRSWPGSSLPLASSAGWWVRGSKTTLYIYIYIYIGDVNHPRKINQPCVSWRWNLKHKGYPFASCILHFEPWDFPLQKTSQLLGIPPMDGSIMPFWGITRRLGVVTEATASRGMTNSWQFAKAKSSRMMVEGKSTSKNWLSGWWLSHPSEKYERQLGWWHSQGMGK